MNDQDYLLFEKYLAKELSPEELTLFENRLKNDSEFKKSLDTYKELNNFLAHKFENENATNDFQKNVKNISATYFNNATSTTKIIKFKAWQYAMAASVVLFFGIYSYNLFSVPSYSDFANYETISLSVRSSENRTLQNAETAFNDKNFIQAEKEFELLLKTDATNQEFQLYKAISEIELNKFNESEKALKNISSGNSVYKHQATWYLALIKLKQKEYKECATILHTIPQDADQYKLAQKLLKKL